MELIAFGLWGFRRLLLQNAQALRLAWVMTSLAAQPQADLLQTAQVLSHLRGSAPRRGSGIIQLVHQAGGHGAQRNQLLAMQLLRLKDLQPARHVSQNADTHLGAGKHELPKKLFPQVNGGARLEHGNHRFRVFTHEQGDLAKGLAGAQVPMSMSSPSS
jgi:hypothetical protein